MSTEAAARTGTSLMSFVRKSDSQGSQPPTDTRKLFIGRTGELLFFVQNILKPEEPSHNIISIWGQSGVGKSTLLARFIDEAHSADYKDYCLTGLSFVYPQEGRFRYHELAQDLFSRHLYQRSKKEYYATRRSIADYYQRTLEEIEGERGLEAYYLMEWQESVLALTDQLLSLPDEASHVKAIELILKTFHHTVAEQNGEIANFLRELSQKQTSIQISTGALQAINNLLQYIEAGARSQERITAASALLERVKLLPSFSPDLRVQIYSDRGWAYLHLKEYDKAINDFNNALALKPEYAWAYGSRGLVYRSLNENQRAIADFDRAIELNPKYAWAYGSRGRAYHLLKNFQQAIDDFDHVIELDPRNTWAYEQRGRVFSKLKDYRQAIEDFDRALELDSNYVWAYFHRGITYRKLKDYQQAIADFDRALELEPHNASIFAQRALTSLWMRNTRQAVIDYNHGWEIDSKYLHNGWMTIWLGMCQEIPDLEVIEQLEIIATTNPENPVAFVCRGVAKWLGKFNQEAMAELEQAMQRAPDEWDPYFWKGMVCASLGREVESMAAVEKALEVELPPVLLIPLRWFEEDKSDFYHKYVMPLMARYNLV